MCTFRIRHKTSIAMKRARKVIKRKIKRNRRRWTTLVSARRRRLAKRRTYSAWGNVRKFIRSILWLIIIAIGVTLFFPITFTILNKRPFWKFALSDEFVDMQIEMQKFWIITAILTVLILGNGNITIPGFSSITSQLVIFWFLLVLLSLILIGMAYLANIIRCLYEDTEIFDMICPRYRIKNPFSMFM